MSYQIRSISFPARSSHHPIILRTEYELNKLQSWQHDRSISSSSTMAESVFFSLSRLEELYVCMDGILQLPSTRQALSNAQHSPFVDSLLDASLKLLDVCTSSRDATLMIKEGVRELQTAVRRRRIGADSSGGLEMIISNYICFRKRMKKGVNRYMALLKQIEQELEGGSLLPQHPDHHLSSLIRAVRDVILANASIFESLLMFVSAQESKTRKVASKWSALASRFTSKQQQAVSKSDSKCASNEFAALDAELFEVAKGTTMSGSEIQSMMHGVEMIVDGMESSLERVFRCLIKARASFLNIRSH
uniref:Uncharacterized protein n=1 Tax=Kalanchoe fedtschenkoi TaxID=63787 RepID=A0A7N0UIX2_KALFE